MKPSLKMSRVHKLCMSYPPAPLTTVYTMESSARVAYRPSPQRLSLTRSRSIGSTLNSDIRSFSAIHRGRLNEQACAESPKSRMHGARYLYKGNRLLSTTGAAQIHPSRAAMASKVIRPEEEVKPNMVVMEFIEEMKLEFIADGLVTRSCKMMALFFEMLEGTPVPEPSAETASMKISNPFKGSKRADTKSTFDPILKPTKTPTTILRLLVHPLLGLPSPILSSQPNLIKDGTVSIQDALHTIWYLQSRQEGIPAEIGVRDTESLLHIFLWLLKCMSIEDLARKAKLPVSMGGINMEEDLGDLARRIWREDPIYIEFTKNWTKLVRERIGDGPNDGTGEMGLWRDLLGDLVENNDAHLRDMARQVFEERVKELEEYKELTENERREVVRALVNQWEKDGFKEDYEEKDQKVSN